MKLNLDEVTFIKTAIGSVSIKASDAPAVSDLIIKLDKELSRQIKLQEKKQPVDAMEVAK